MIRLTLWRLRHKLEDAQVCYVRGPDIVLLQAHEVIINPREQTTKRQEYRLVTRVVLALAPSDAEGAGETSPAMPGNTYGLDVVETPDQIHAQLMADSA